MVVSSFGFSRLNRVHLESARFAGSIRQVFGDGQLLKTSPTYRSLRKSTKLTGHRFSGDDPFFYSMAPLVALPDILKHKVIPYYDSATLFGRLAKSRSASSYRIEISQIRSNYIVHESAHALCAGVARNRALRVRNHYEFFLLVLQEAYASVCEIMVQTDSESLSHREFCRHLTYHLLNEQELVRVRNFRTRYGDKKAFRLILAAYIYSNYLYENLSDKDLGEVLNSIDLDFTKNPVELRLAQKVFRQSLSLDKAFSIVTASHFLKIIGSKRQLYFWTEANPLRFLRRDEVLSMIRNLFGYLEAEPKRG